MEFYIHTHCHSEYSVLDGMSRVAEMVEVVKRNKQPALAITDHGRLASVPELVYACKEHDIKPIIGQEFYIAGDDATNHALGNNHLVLLALNDRGYHILCELSSEASQPENFYRYPRIDYKMLRRYGKEMKNIVAYTSCQSGEIPRDIIQGNIREAKEKLKIYRNIFPNLFFELQAHAIHPKQFRPEEPPEEELDFYDRENLLNKTLWKWHTKYKIPLVVTNDSHYTNDDDHHAHDVLLAMQTGSNIHDVDRFKFAGEGYHLRITGEMRTLFPKKVWAQSSKSLKWIYDHSEIKLPEFTDKKFYIPSAGFSNPIQKIKSICLKNLKQRVDKKYWKKYKKQLKYELSVVEKAGFADEFLIVYDYVNWARDNGISISSGRGSMAGVLISYLMRITDVDPIRFNLSFERALNPARPSLPDFDVDFNDKAKVIDYIKEKYGEENVMKIGTFNRMKPRSLLSGILRTKGYNFQDSLRYTKQLPDTFDIVGARASSDLRETLATVSPDLEELFQRDSEIPELMLAYNELVKGMGSHAGGVIISDGTKKLREIIPGVRVRDDTELVSQFDKKDVEKIGFIKFDILSINTLNLIQGVLDLIGENILDGFPDGDNLDDAKTYELINKQILTYIFQLDGAANRHCISQIGGVHTFEDIVSVSSLSRPGSAQFIPSFASNKDNTDYINYSTKKLKPILDGSNGVILYQEQVMQIAYELANFNMIQLDDIKEMIKGKDRQKFADMKPLFMNGCLKNGLKERQAEAVWKMIEDASGYLYNRAHAVSYSIISYITAYLKANYPLEFFTVAMNISDEKRRSELYQDAERMQVEFIRPSVVKSDVLCTIEDGKVRVGLNLIKGIGEKTATTFVSHRDAHGLKSAMDTLPKRVVGKVMQKALEESGAYGNKYTNYSLQLKRLGFSVISNISSKQKRIIDSFWEEGTYMNRVHIGGIVQSVRRITTKHGDPMGFADLFYKGQKNSLVFFPNNYDKIDDFVEGNIMLVKGERQNNYDSIIPYNYKQI